jgi:hypothetical protein
LLIVIVVNDDYFWRNKMTKEELQKRVSLATQEWAHSRLMSGSHNDTYNISYEKLEYLFGKPSELIEERGNQTDAYWYLQFDSESICIYNWKNGPNYTKYGMVSDIDEIDKWCISSSNKNKIVEFVHLISTIECEEDTDKQLQQINKINNIETLQHIADLVNNKINGLQS